MSKKLQATPVYFNILYLAGVQIIELHQKTQTLANFLNYSKIVSYYSFLDCVVLYIDILL